MNILYENPCFSLQASADCAFIYQTAGHRFEVGFPCFEVEGKLTEPTGAFALIGEKTLNEDIRELTFECGCKNGLSLGLVMRVCGQTPIIRFKYVLSSAMETAMTKTEGADRLKYLDVQMKDGAKLTEVRFSEYNYLFHSYVLKELKAFDGSDSVMGPILVQESEGVSMLSAYEHGAQYPDKFVDFYKKGRTIKVRAVKGNYYSGQKIGPGRTYETIWLQCGAVSGGIDELAKAYRTFQLCYCSLNRESRKPYIFYNTWAYQERNKFYNGREYLTSICCERVNEEIEIAHKMGVDVFVIDTGWYQKTGDWEVNLKKFPDQLKKIKAKLENYGMKLGLWFNPSAAAKTSKMYLENQGNVAGKRGETDRAFEVWETEESYPMCLVSDYWLDYAKRLSFLADELGVSYFKWDAVGMYGCNRGGHLHGGEENAAEECEDCYAFNVVKYLGKIVDYVCRKHPEAIFDFDITEGGRCVGLAFLSSGKYFAVNNGPYYSDYNIVPGQDQWTNIFVNPGAARTWVCRKALEYDRWVPSVLFLTHYLPDDGEDSQMLNLASLILGQNGIWGDLAAVSEKGVGLFSQVLGEYKKVRDDLTAAFPRVMGEVGETFEVHEKLNARNGRGAVVLFGNAPGQYTYRVKTDGRAVIFGSAQAAAKNGYTEITVEFSGQSAAIVFFE